MRLNQLMKVLAVERCGSISKAAEQLGVAQSALSKSIGELEKELGITIFVRTARGILPTEAGREALRLVKSIAANVDNILLATGEQVQLAGVVTAALVPAVYNALAVDMIKEFRASYPLVNLRLLEMDANNAARAVVEGKCDVGMGLFMPQEQEQYLALLGEMGLASSLLIQVPFKVFMSARNPLAVQEEVSLEDIADVPLFEFMSVGTEKILRGSRKKMNNTCYRLYNRETLKKLVSMDYGMAFMPEFLEWQDHYVESGLITGRYVTDFSEMLNCYLLYSQQMITSPLENTFVISLTAHLERLIAAKD